MRKYRRRYLQIAKRDDLVYLNGDVFTSTEDPLRLAHSYAHQIKGPFCIWKCDRDVMLASYRTSEKWGEPMTPKMPLDEIWPLFVAFVELS